VNSLAFYDRDLEAPSISLVVKVLCFLEWRVHVLEALLAFGSLDGFDTFLLKAEE